MFKKYSDFQYRSEDCFISANSAGPDEMPQNTSHMGLQDLSPVFSIEGPVHFSFNSCTQVQIGKIFWRKIVIIFSSISLNICSGCSKELSH